jgi:hypothetical protein
MFKADIISGETVVKYTWEGDNVCRDGNANLFWVQRSSNSAPRPAKPNSKRSRLAHFLVSKDVSIDGDAGRRLG